MPATTVYDIKPEVFINALSAQLKNEHKITAPQWTINAKTGVSR